MLNSLDGYVPAFECDVFVSQYSTEPSELTTYQLTANIGVSWRLVGSLSVCGSQLWTQIKHTKMQFGLVCNSLTKLI